MSFPYDLSNTEAAGCAAAWIAVLTLAPQIDYEAMLDSPIIDAALNALPAIAAAAFTAAITAVLYYSRKSILFPVLKTLRLR